MWIHKVLWKRIWSSDFPLTYGVVELTVRLLDHSSRTDSWQVQYARGFGAELSGMHPCQQAERYFPGRWIGRGWGSIELAYAITEPQPTWLPCVGVHELSCLWSQSGHKWGPISSHCRCSYAYQCRDTLRHGTCTAVKEYVPKLKAEMLKICYSIESAGYNH
jgi:hypothetical protein